MRHTRRPLLRKSVTDRILALYEQYHRPEFIGLDPLITLRGFSRRKDLETAGFVAAILSYGRVETIIRNVSWLFERMENEPARFLRETTFEEKKRCFNGFRHRFNNGDDVALLLQAVGALTMEHGSMEKFVAGAFSNDGSGVRGALSGVAAVIAGTAQRWNRAVSRGFRFLVPSPAGGSACKRLNMYLRWMVRPADGIDLGVWHRIRPEQLMMPVDTHIASIATRFGLTGRKNSDWWMAEEITGGLRRIDPVDPVRFDFSLCRSGMVTMRNGAA